MHCRNNVVRRKTRVSGHFSLEIIRDRIPAEVKCDLVDAITVCPNRGRSVVGNCIHIAYYN